MKNYIKIMFAALVLVFAGVILFAFVVYNKEDTSAKEGETVLMLNDIVKISEENWDLLKKAGNSYDKDEKHSEGFERVEELFSKTSGYESEFSILDETGEVLYESRKDGGRAEERLSVETAIKKNYPYRYVIRDSRVAGTVIIQDSGMNKLDDVKLRLIIGLSLCGLMFFLAMLFFYIYVERNIVIPFNRMEEFAGKVALGRLDEPIVMDRGNMFGAFSESFDIMREELAESKKRELVLQKKERELVASLSHDLKTPITGIKLTTELLQAKLNKGDIQGIIEKLGNIYQKADQIDVLVSDLFASTLDDLGEFRVSLNDETSSVIDGIVRKYDDRNLVRQENIPQVIINTDVRRLSQVIGNIISNSYKYAATDIDISYRVTEGFLQMSVRDYGPGVPQDEIDLITNKFYRGRAVKDGKEEGSGLGLYIAKSLMEKMNGEFIAESDGKGLEITLLIPLS